MSSAICPTCGSRDFRLIEGFYYCGICNAQSQEVREVNRDAAFLADFSTGGRNRPMLYELGKRKKQATNEQKTQKDVLDETTLVEAFTCLLRVHADAFCTLGIPAGFRDVLFALWCRFLCVRDAERRSAGRSKTAERTVGRRLRTLSSNSPVKRERRDTEDNSFLDEEVELSEEEEDEKAEDEEHSASLSTPSPAPRARPRRLIRGFSFKLVLGLDYLALLKVGIIDFQPCDIIRLVRRRVLPLADTARYLPPPLLNREPLRAHLRLLLKQLRATSFAASFLLPFTSRLASLLDNAEPQRWLPFDVHFELRELITRVALDVGLPREFIRGSRFARLVEVCERTPVLARALRFKLGGEGLIRECPTPDVQAYACVLVALRLCFGLDDRVEHELSVAASEVGEKMFVFDDWMSRLRLVRAAMRLAEDGEDDEAFVELFQRGWFDWREEDYWREFTEAVAQQVAIRPLAMPFETAPYARDERLAAILAWDDDEPRRQPRRRRRRSSRRGDEDVGVEEMDDSTAFSILFPLKALTETRVHLVEQLRTKLDEKSRLCARSLALFIADMTHTRIEALLAVCGASARDTFVDVCALERQRRAGRSLLDVAVGEFPLALANEATGGLGAALSVEPRRAKTEYFERVRDELSISYRWLLEFFAELLAVPPWTLFQCAVRIERELIEPLRDEESLKFV